MDNILLLVQACAEAGKSESMCAITASGACVVHQPLGSSRPQAAGCRRLPGPSHRRDEPGIGGGGAHNGISRPEELN